MNAPQPLHPSLPLPQEQELARSSSRRMAAIVGPRQSERLRVVIDDETIEVPVSALKLFAEILSQMALGRAVQITPHTAELTTQQAADFLNVSRPFLIKQLESGVLPFHKVGSHRRIKFQDVVSYGERMRADQRAAIDEMLSSSSDNGWSRDP